MNEKWLTRVRFPRKSICYGYNCGWANRGKMPIVILTRELWTPQWTEGAPLETDWPAASPWTTQAFTVTWLSPASQRQCEREKRRTEIWLPSKLPHLTYMPFVAELKGNSTSFTHQSLFADLGQYYCIHVSRGSCVKSDSCQLSVL